MYELVCDSEIKKQHLSDVSRATYELLLLAEKTQSGFLCFLAKAEQIAREQDPGKKMLERILSGVYIGSDPKGSYVLSKFFDEQDFMSKVVDAYESVFFSVKQDVNIESSWRRVPLGKTGVVKALPTLDMLDDLC